jgi:hypothetical protein
MERRQRLQMSLCAASCDHSKLKTKMKIKLSIVMRGCGLGIAVIEAAMAMIARVAEVAGNRPNAV